MPEPNLTELIERVLLDEAHQAAGAEGEEASSRPSNTKQVPQKRVRKLMPETKTKYYKVATEYLKNGFNRTKAYASVYPDAKQRTCESMGSEVINHPEVQSFLSDVFGRMTTEAELDAQYVVKELLNGAMTNAVDYLPDDTADLSLSDYVSHLKSLPANVQRRLRSVDIVSQDYTNDDGSVSHKTGIKFRTIDPQRSVEQLGKATGILRDQVDITHHFNPGDTIMKAVARAKHMGKIEPGRIFDEKGNIIEEGKIVDGRIKPTGS